jgi:hypothetical protein
MRLSSLAHQTDLMLARFQGEVKDHGRYITVKTPANPGYHWGNYIIFDHPPAAGDFKRWKELYRREFTHYPEIKHMTFAWDQPDPGQTDEFLQAGFHLDKSVVLTTAQVQRPPKFNETVTVRPLHSEQDWEQTTLLQILCRSQDHEPMSYEKYKRAQMANFREMSRAGLGGWFGAFLNGKLVGDLGVFHQNGIARYQQVSTHPDYRRLGVCGTLVHATACHALERFGTKTLVMVADSEYHAARIYESVGFQPTEKTFSLGWWIS